MKLLSNNLSKLFLLLVLLIFYIYSIFPLLQDGFFTTFDDVQVVRIHEMVKELQGGQFPVRYIQDLGNGGGYMLYNTYPPFVYYIAAGLHFIGFSLVQSTKLIYILGYLVGGIGVWLLLRRVAGYVSATMGAILFLISPFFNYEVYTRGSLPEFFAFAVMPWVLWAFFELKTKNNLPLFIVGSLSYGIVLTAHTFPGFVTTLLLILWILLPPFKKKNFLTLTSTFLLRFGLASFFVIPFIFEQQYTAYSTNYFGDTSYATNFFNPLQVGGIQKINISFLPPILGVPIFLGAIVSSVALFIVRKKISVEILFSFFVFFASIFLIWNVSNFVWKGVDILKRLQFPWRFFIPATIFGIVIIFHSLSYITSSRIKVAVSMLLIILTYIFYPNYHRPREYNFIANYYAEDPCSLTSWGNEYLPRWVSNCLPKSKKRGDITPVFHFLCAYQVEWKYWVSKKSYGVARLHLLHEVKARFF